MQIMCGPQKIYRTTAILLKRTSALNKLIVHKKFSGEEIGGGASPTEIVQHFYDLC